MSVVNFAEKRLQKLIDARKSELEEKFLDLSTTLSDQNAHEYLNSVIEPLLREQVELGEFQVPIVATIEGEKMNCIATFNIEVDSVEILS